MVQKLSGAIVENYVCYNYLTQRYRAFRNKTHFLMTSQKKENSQEFSFFCFFMVGLQSSLFIPKEFLDAAQTKAYPFVTSRTYKAQRVLCHGSRHDEWHRPSQRLPHPHASPWFFRLVQ